MKEMLDTSHELVEIAKKLQVASERAVSKEEIEKLQHAQQKCMDKLIELDQKIGSSKKNFPEKKEIEKKLLEFQKLNSSFFEHLQRKLSVIHFTPPNQGEKDEPEEE